MRAAPSSRWYDGRRIAALSIAATLIAPAGCVTASVTDGGPGPRILPTELQLGALGERTDFELDSGLARVEAGTESKDGPETERDEVEADRVDTPKQRRRRKALFLLGASMAGFGVVGTLGFGIGGRVVQAQLANGYDEGTLTRDDEDRLTTTGEVMNGMAIGSAVVGLAGVILASTVYGIDHARCGDLPPKRKQCPSREDQGTDDENVAPVVPVGAPLEDDEEGDDAEPSPTTDVAPAPTDDAATVGPAPASGGAPGASDGKAPPAGAPDGG